MTLEEWTDKFAKDLQAEISVHLSFVKMTEEERLFLLRMTMISVRGWNDPR